MGEGCGDRADVPRQCVCLFGGTLRSMEPEEGSLRALYASRTEAGGGEGSCPRSCLRSLSLGTSCQPELSAELGICQHCQKLWEAHMDTP